MPHDKSDAAREYASAHPDRPADVDSRIPEEEYGHENPVNLEADPMPADSAIGQVGSMRPKVNNGAMRPSPDRPETTRYDITIKERASDERPRERLEKLGASALSVTELLAIQLRTGSLEQSALGLAGELLHAFGGLRGLAAASREELCRVKGIGPVKAIEICAAVEISRRLSVLSADEKPCIRSPQDVSNLLMAEMRDLKKEHLKSLILDSKNRVMKTCTVSIGTLDSSLVHPREVFRDAILASAAAIIVVHNHPSGDPSPSAEDRRITQRLHECGELLGVALLDHIILGDNRFVSLKERGVF
jgi:DNA repair protein RadC